MGPRQSWNSPPAAASPGPRSARANMAAAFTHGHSSLTPRPAGSPWLPAGGAPGWGPDPCPRQRSALEARDTAPSPLDAAGSSGVAGCPSRPSRASLASSGFHQPETRGEYGQEEIGLPYEGVQDPGPRGPRRPLHLHHARQSGSQEGEACASCFSTSTWSGVPARRTHCPTCT